MIKFEIFMLSITSNVAQIGCINFIKWPKLDEIRNLLFIPSIISFLLLVSRKKNKYGAVEHYVFLILRIRRRRRRIRVLSFSKLGFLNC